MSAFKKRSRSRDFLRRYSGARVASTLRRTRIRQPMENPADNDNEPEGDAESGGGGGMQMEQLQSYLKFAKFVLRKRWLTTVLTIVVGIGLTIPLSIYWPRTYSCTT